MGAATARMVENKKNSVKKYCVLRVTSSMVAVVLLGTQLLGCQFFLNLLAKNRLQKYSKKIAPVFRVVNKAHPSKQEVKEARSLLEDVKVPTEAKPLHEDLESLVAKHSEVEAIISLVPMASSVVDDLIIGEADGISPQDIAQATPEMQLILRLGVKVYKERTQKAYNDCQSKVQEMEEELNQMISDGEISSSVAKKVRSELMKDVNELADIWNTFAVRAETLNESEWESLLERADELQKKLEINTEYQEALDVGDRMDELRELKKRIKKTTSQLKSDYGVSFNEK